MRDNTANKFCWDLQSPPAAYRISRISIFISTKKQLAFKWQRVINIDRMSGHSGNWALCNKHTQENSECKFWTDKEAKKKEERKNENKVAKLHQRKRRRRSTLKNRRAKGKKKPREVKLGHRTDIILDSSQGISLNYPDNSLVHKLKSVFALLLRWFSENVCKICFTGCFPPISLAEIVEEACFTYKTPKHSFPQLVIGLVIFEIASEFRFQYRSFDRS